MTNLAESLKIQYMMIELQNKANKNQIAEFGKTSLWKTTNISSYENPLFNST